MPDQTKKDGFPVDGESRIIRRTLFESFHCERRDEDLLMHVCMTDYVNANALRSKNSPCFSCPIGEANRLRFAKEG